MKALLLICAMLFAVLTQSAFAEGVGLGSDMWTRIFEQWGLFTPHVNFCDSSTEVFVAVGGGDRGFCMEKDNRANALTWEAAREDCATDKKRLPEPGEYKFACKNPPTGLINMTGTDYRWASNFTLPFDVNAAPGVSIALGAAVVGANSSCTDGGYQLVAANGSPNEQSMKYRCVR